MARKFDSRGPKRTPGRIQQLLKNPGTRAALQDKFLTPEQLRQRNLNRRLDTPVTQGSQLTNRQLARQAKAAVQVQYGRERQSYNQNLEQAQQHQKDLGGWYDQYLAELRQHQQNIGNTNQQATTALQGLTGSIGQLGAGALAEGATDATKGEAANAAAVRQGLLASFGGMAASQGKSANDYADTLSRVVGPGQKLTALTRALRNQQAIRDQLADLATREGAYDTNYRQQTITDEAKNVLAAQALNLDTAEAAEDAAAGRATRREQRRKNQAQEQADARQDAQQAADQAGEVNQYGYTDADWRAMSTEQRRKVIAESKRSKGTAGKGGKGPDWLPQGQMGAGLAQLPDLKTYADKAKTGEAFIKGHARQQKLDRAGAKRKILENSGGLKHPVLLSAALDAVYDGHLSPDTVRRLIKAGYQPSQVAETLRVPTAGQTKQAGGAAGYFKGTGRPD